MPVWPRHPPRLAPVETVQCKIIEILEYVILAPEYSVIFHILISAVIGHPAEMTVSNKKVLPCSFFSFLISGCCLPLLQRSAAQEVMLQSSGLGCWDSSNQVVAYTPKLLPYPNKNVLPLSQLFSCHKHFLCAVTGVLTCSDKTFIKRTIILQDVNVSLLAIEYIICNVVFFFLLYRFSSSLLLRHMWDNGSFVWFQLQS